MPALVSRRGRPGYNGALPQGFPSGQRGRAVNPLAQPSEVRILPPALHLHEPESARADSGRAKILKASALRTRRFLFPYAFCPGLQSRHALLAQSVEHLHGKEGVDGSSPSEGLAATPRNKPDPRIERGPDRASFVFVEQIWNRRGENARKAGLARRISVAADPACPELPRESAALQRPEDGVVVEAVADDETVIVDCDSRALAVAFEQR